MKVVEVVPIQPLVVDGKAAARLLGGPQVLKELVVYNWLCPISRRNKGKTLFSVASITAAATRLCEKGRPTDNH